MALDVLITRALGSAGVTVDVESNVLPTLRVYDAAATGPSWLDTLGIQTRFVVRTADGRTLTQYGEPVTTDYVLAAVLAVVGLSALVLLGAATARLLR